MKRQALGTVIVAATLLFILAGTLPQLALASVPGDTYTYNLGYGDTYFLQWSPNYGLKPYDYTYTNMEESVVNTSGETLNVHQNVGQYYRDGYYGLIDWGPMYVGGRYWSNGTQVASINSYQPITIYLRSGWAEWGGENYSNISVSSTVGSRQVEDSVTFSSDEWLSPTTLTWDYTF